MASLPPEQQARAHIDAMLYDDGVEPGCHIPFQHIFKKYLYRVVP